MNQQLQYSILDAQKIDGEGRITNIAIKKNIRKWNMLSLDDFFIFTIKFAAPSTVAYIDIKGHNTHIATLTFKDHNNKFILEKELQFIPHDQSKIIEVWERPLTTFIDVKLINSPFDRKKIGLNYLNFLGKCDYARPAQQASIVAPSTNSKITASNHNNAKKAEEKIPISINIDDEQIGKVLDLDAEPLQSVHKYANQIYFEDEEAPMITQTPMTSQANSFHQVTSVKSIQPSIIQSSVHVNQVPQKQVIRRQPIQPIEIEPDYLPQPAFSQDVRELTDQQLEAAIVEEPQMSKSYVTYPYEQAGQWWAILKMVRKDWVLAQTNVQNEKGVKAQDRMSGKITVQHLYKRNILVEGFQKQRKDMNEQTAVSMGATILRDVQPGCIVVTSREYGQKIRRMKRFKNTKIVTQEYILNCKRFDRLLNQDDYLIR